MKICRNEDVVIVLTPYEARHLETLLLNTEPGEDEELLGTAGAAVITRIHDGLRDILHGKK